MKSEYLLFNALVLASPLTARLFYKKTKILGSKTFLKVALIPALFFITYDYLATGHFWYFNKDFILGFKILNLPLEEILFFFTVPYACLFIWHNLRAIFSFEKEIRIPGTALVLFVYFLFLWIFLKTDLVYTYTSIFLFLTALILDLYVARTGLAKKKVFFIFSAITIFLTLIFNGYLTARPIVLYNSEFKSNINIFTVPSEDFIWGWSLIYFCLILYEKNTHKGKSFT